MYKDLLKHVLNEDSVFKPASKDEIAARKQQYLDIKIKEVLAKCTKNEDGTYSCDGDVDLSNLKLTKLPVKFRKVSGGFYCYHNRLTSLEGVPQKVGGNFSCDYNRLTSLKGASQKVGGSFYCGYNQVKFTEEDVRKVCNVEDEINV